MGASRVSSDSGFRVQVFGPRVQGLWMGGVRSRAFPPRILGKLERIKGKTTLESLRICKGWRVRS